MGNTDISTNGAGAGGKAASVISENIVPLIIGGKHVPGPATFPVINPANGQELWNAGGASVKEAIQAVEAAEAAFPTWARTKPSVRRDVFLKAAELFRDRIDELTEYQKQETAADPNFVQWILGLTVDNLKEVAGKTSFVAGTFPSSEDDGRGAIVIKEPYGVVLGIAPW
jgi:acyl-CoA reductase-like NAD-dependent aldehyde dehydrogenase